MRSGELARAAGTTVRALRYYEQQGLLHARRSANGYRDYDERAVTLVRNIRRLLAVGFTAQSVRAFTPCLTEDVTAEGLCPDASRAIAGRLAALDQQIADLTDTRERLAAEWRQLAGGSTQDKAAEAAGR
ncbi:MerR family transcriptional regulator [Goodfellowiella coeruleoviolacea]|uniref:DNA-binding transcriptional regulator, MerR family n=1 Tax=Goodfellowiella coeruleoviolacea TaxID=334858 RepID=A0AAE3KP56_9PSEU|nr:MerR family transcriptional regulator [Goodfellowiella coeruleoviolacea]MCP2169463.1 DNA-binding transcriptional regulator, MerR family [Goodfellowiella coeruleoviolacea]